MIIHYSEKRNLTVETVKVSSWESISGGTTYTYKANVPLITPLGLYTIVSIINHTCDENISFMIADIKKNKLIIYATAQPTNPVEFTISMED